MTCPRCAFDAGEASACARCGVIFGKVREPRERPAPEPRPRRSHSRAATLGPWVVVAVVAAGALAGVRATRNRPPSTLAAAPAQGLAPAAGEAAAIAAGPPPSMAPAELPALAPPPASADLTDADVEAARLLAARVTAHAALSDADVLVAQGLFDRHPAEQPLRDLLEGTLLARAAQEQALRQYAAAAAHLERASAAQPSSARGQKALLGLFLDTGDWPRAEAAGREALARAPTDPEVYQGLGFALMRQDRNREAAEVLRKGLEIVEDPVMRALLARLEKGLRDEKGMTEQNLAHFHVRYDGTEHEDVGREILRALERHYATLAQALDHQPASAMTVILFSTQAYYDASGAPAWSGGVYDLTDGRIRVPIGGLTASLTPDIDTTLLHELTHAFVWDRTHGVAQRELQEGLAQYMEGKRVASLLRKDQLQILADGRAGGVYGFYFGALAFVEYLYAQRGQGGVNDLLRVMGETGSEDEAYKQVYGDDYQTLHRAWQARFKQQDGS